MGDGIRRERALTGPHLVDFRLGVARSEFGHDEDDGGSAKVGGEGKKNQGRHKRGVPVGHTSPPIREGISLLPELISHKPPLSSTTSSSLSLMIKKNGGRKAL